MAAALRTRVSNTCMGKPDMDEDKQFETEQKATADNANDPSTEAVETGSDEGGADRRDDVVESLKKTAQDKDAEIERLEAEIEELKGNASEEVVAALKATAETAQAQLEDMNQQHARLAADFDNFRKRTQKEKADLEEQAKCSTLKALLPVIDNFERARTQIKPQTEGETTIHKSYQSVYKQMVDCLKRLGVAPMRPEGEEFDPNLHDAVMREPTDEYPDGTVIEELMRGYTIGDRVLRHAMVKVATAPDPVVSSEESSAEASDD